MLTDIMQDSVSTVDLRGVFSVPPLPRKADGRRSLDFDAAELVAKHIETGGITRFLYGGNAFLYHITLAEYEALVDWLSSFGQTRWAIPEHRAVVRPRDGSVLSAAASFVPLRDGAALRRSARRRGHGGRDSRTRPGIADCRWCCI